MTYETGKSIETNFCEAEPWEDQEPGRTRGAKQGRQMLNKCRDNIAGG